MCRCLFTYFSFRLPELAATTMHGLDLTTIVSFDGKHERHSSIGRSIISSLRV